MRDPETFRAHWVQHTGTTFVLRGAALLIRWNPPLMNKYSGCVRKQHRLLIFVFVLYSSLKRETVFIGLVHSNFFANSSRNA
jgi:hypothetical protein